MVETETATGYYAGDVTARLGYAVGTWMAYVKGGFRIRRREQQ